MRRRVLMETKESGTKYPLVNGRHEFSDGSYVEVSNGNHVEMYVLSESTFINLSNVFQNSLSATSYNNIDNLPEIFTIPNGSHCTLQLSNADHSPMYSRSTVNFRLADGRTSSNFNEDIYFSQTNNVVIDRDMETDFHVGCFLMWNQGINFKLEFDVEFTVNGERWI